MTTTIVENIEIQEGSDISKIFYVREPSTELPKDLRGCVAEIQVRFELLNEPIIYRSDVSPNITVGGLFGTIKVMLPWIAALNTNQGKGTYSIYLRYPNGANVMQYKGFVTVVRGTTDYTLPGSSVVNDPFPDFGTPKGAVAADSSMSVVLATDHPVINVSSTAGLGSLALVPAASANGTAIGELPAGAVGVRIYLAPADKVTFTISGAQPVTPPTYVFDLSPTDTGPNWDENLSSGQMMYITKITGTPKFRWI